MGKTTVLLQIYLWNCEAKKSFCFHRGFVQGVFNSALIVVLEYRNVHFRNNKSGYGFSYWRCSAGWQNHLWYAKVHLVRLSNFDESIYRDLVFVKIIGDKNQRNKVFLAITLWMLNDVRITWSHFSEVKIVAIYSDIKDTLKSIIHWPRCFNKIAF